MSLLPWISQPNGNVYKWRETYAYHRGVLIFLLEVRLWFFISGTTISWFSSFSFDWRSEHERCDVWWRCLYSRWRFVFLPHENDWYIFRILIIWIKLTHKNRVGLCISHQSKYQRGCSPNPLPCRFYSSKSSRGCFAALIRVWRYMKDFTEYIMVARMHFSLWRLMRSSYNE